MMGGLTVGLSTPLPWVSEHADGMTQASLFEIASHLGPVMPGSILLIAIASILGSVLVLSGQTDVATRLVVVTSLASVVLVLVSSVGVIFYLVLGVPALFSGELSFSIGPFVSLLGIVLILWGSAALVRGRRRSEYRETA
jgi:hypothetical protein